MFQLFVRIDTLADLRGFAAAVTQVVQFRSTDDAVTEHLDAADARAVVRERTLNADAVGHTADGKALADPAALDLDHDAFKVLKTLTVSFDDLHEYTDGIAEAINTDEEQYGTARMIDALNENRSAPMKETLKGVKVSVDEFVGEAEQFDDQTMMGLRYLGPGAGKDN